MNTLECIGCCLHDFLASSGGTSEADHANIRMFNKSLPCIIAARDNINNAIRYAGLFNQLAKHKGSERRARRGLKDNRASCSKRRTNFPSSHHHWIIPRSDLTHNTNWLASINGRISGHEFTCMRAMCIASRACKETQVINSKRDITAEADELI